MKIIKLQQCLLTALSLSFVLSCSKYAPFSPQCEEIPVIFSGLKALETRSAAAPADFREDWENRVNGFTLFHFRNGRLLDCYYFQAEETPCIPVFRGERNSFAAIANCGDLRNLIPYFSEEKVLQDVLLDVPSPEDLFSSGMPMAGTGIIRDGDEGKYLEIPLVRLLGKVVLSVSNPSRDGAFVLEHGHFIVNGVRLCQSPVRTSPFRETFSASSKEEVAEGDRIVSSSELEKFDSGSPLCLYGSENMQGNLLPADSGMSDRVPESIGEKASLATFLEISGDYEDNSGGLKVSSTMRLYLGENGGNFDFRRNSELCLKLGLTDAHGYVDVTWRLSPVVSDERTLAFAEESYGVAAGVPCPVSLLCNGVPAGPSDVLYRALGLRYSISDNLSEAGVFFDEDKMELRTGFLPDQMLDGKIEAVSWDGRLRAAAGVFVAGRTSVTGDSGTETGSGTVIY